MFVSKHVFTVESQTQRWEAGREGIILHLQRGMLRLKEGHTVTWPKPHSWGSPVFSAEESPEGGALLAWAGSKGAQEVKTPCSTLPDTHTHPSPPLPHVGQTFHWRNAPITASLSIPHSNPSWDWLSVTMAACPCTCIRDRARQRLSRIPKLGLDRLR